MKNIMCVALALVSFTLIGSDRDTRFTCKSSGGKFAVYDKKKSRFLDGYYSKTGPECRKTIVSIRNGLVCSVDQVGKYAVRKIKSLDFLNKYYSMTLKECKSVLGCQRRGRICLKGNLTDGYARFDMKENRFLDKRYNLSLEDCDATLDF